MLGPAISTRGHRDARTHASVLAALAIAVVVVLNALAAPAAHATEACEDSWVNTAGGSWFTGANWSKGSPPSSEESACVTAEGTYTVMMTQMSGTVSVRSLTIGALAGKQTLYVDSSCLVNAILSTTEGIVSSSTAAITLTSSGCGNDITLAGPILNSGTLASAGTGIRTIEGNLTNKGTLEILTSTSFSGSGASLVNEGTIELWEVPLSVSSSGVVANEASGAIVALGRGTVAMGPGTTFDEAGTTSGAKPVILENGTLSYTGAGKSAIALHGSNSLSGNLGSEQSLSIESTCYENVTATAIAHASFTSAGTITLTNGDRCGNNAVLAISEGTFTNTGTLFIALANGGGRTIEGNLTNKGTLAVKTTTAYNGASAALTNEGAITIREGVQLSVSSGSSFTNGAGGSVSTNGTGVLLQTGGTFTEGAGTTSGAKPVIVDDATLAYTGAGKSAIALHGSSSLSGNLGSEQSLSIESTCGEDAVATAAASFTSAGTITLTNGDGCGNNATLAMGEGTFTNTGGLVVEIARGGQRGIQGNFTNLGLMEIDANATDSAPHAVVQNNGSIDLAGYASLTISGDATVTNGVGGAIFAAGGAILGAGSSSLVETGGTFDEAGGDTIGTTPVIVDDGALNYSEHGEGPIQLRGTSSVSGTLRAGRKRAYMGEVLDIASTCSEPAVVTVAGSLNLNGTLQLTNGDGCGNNATLDLKGGTLTNNGILNVENPHGGSRTIAGDLVNNAILRIAAGESLHVTGAYTQAATGRLKSFVASSSSFGTLSVAGAASIAGTLVLGQQAFKASLGQSYPILTSSSLAGTFASEAEDQINYTGLYYRPTYSATGVTLLPTQATEVPAPTTGAPGTTVTVTGSGYIAGDTITPTFTDYARVKTTYPTVTVNSGGEFSTEITIPAGAAAGNGEIVVKSTQTGVHIGEGFDVT